jgi:hypothetical protein
MAERAKLSEDDISSYDTTPAATKQRLQVSKAIMKR